MAKLKFIHASDLHLDTPFKGLSRWNKDLAERLKYSSRKSFSRIIDLCIKEEVDFLLIAGDIFDSEQQSLAGQLHFIKELERLSAKHIATYFICGNHDPLSNWNVNLKFPALVKRFDSGKVSHVAHMKEGKVLADIYGTSYQEKKELNNLALGYEKQENTAPFSIALLHGTIGSQGRHDPYAPFSVADVVNKGFDYWALGHIHKFEIIRSEEPAIVYSGNHQGRDFGECGEKGCVLVEIEENKSPDLKFIPLQNIRFEEIVIDLEGIDNILELSQLVRASIRSVGNFRESESYIFRIKFTGKTGLHSLLKKEEELLQLAREFEEAHILIDSIKSETSRPIDYDHVRNSDEFPGDVLKSFEILLKDKELIESTINSALEEAGPQMQESLKKLTEEESLALVEHAKRILLDLLISDEQ